MLGAKGTALGAVPSVREWRSSMFVFLTILIVLTYAAVAGALGVGAYAMGFASIPEAALLGVLLFMLFSQLHIMVARTAERRLARANQTSLRLITERLAVVEATASDARRELEVMDSALEERLHTRQEEMIAALKVLEERLSALKGGMAGAHAAPVAAPSQRREAKEAREEEGEFRSDDELLDVIREALEQNRVDLYLQPIVSLPQRKIRIYEALTRLRDKNGVLIYPRDYLRVAVPAGLIGVIDNILLFRCVQVVRRLMKRAPGIAISCNISGYSLRDTSFFPQFVDYMEANLELARQLIFEFGQEDLQSCSSQEEACLERLARQGFAFSMDKIRSLDIDFKALGRFNFRYIKVEAKTLLAGMRQAGAPVEAQDLKSFARRYGIDMIVEKIEDERTLLNVLDHDVDFGQGFLFGEPMPLARVMAAYETPEASARGEPKTLRPELRVERTRP
jgi:cyclic-di-GMP phosphodiesterase TipF (flagellum assembly factor)